MRERDVARSGQATDPLETIRLELRRGCLVLAVLASLRDEQYGYTLRRDLTALGIVIDEGTLYPLLRRLETQGLLVSEWREHEKRNKRFYKLSLEGRTVLRQLVADWRALDASLNEILGEHNGAGRTVSRRG